MPVAQTFTGGSGNGTITFDQDLDQTTPPDPAAFIRGLGANFRLGDSAVFGASNRVDIHVGAVTPGAVPVGWKYTPTGTGDLKGLTGAPVVAFENFTG